MNFLIWCIAFISGNLWVQQLDVQPDFFSVVIIIVFFLILFFVSYYLRYVSVAAMLLGGCLGFLWAWSFAVKALAEQLPEEWIKKNIEVTGQVISIPQIHSHRTTFQFRVNQFIYEGKIYQTPRYLRLSWYEDAYSPSKHIIPELKVGQTWQFTVRLKPPQRFASPFASDQTQQAFAQKIAAVGYVYTKFPVSLLSEEIMWKDKINHYREYLSFKIKEALKGQAQVGIIKALAIGEKGEISTEEWKILQATGTSHLVAISGLHIGLVAGLILALFKWLSSLFPFWVQRYPAVLLASGFSIIAALIYSALAGFAIPTQRSLIMLSLMMLCLTQRKYFPKIYVFAAAMVLVVLWDPFSTLSMSFWLSFIAVAVLFYLLSGRILSHSDKKSRIFQWGYFQMGIGVLLIPITLWFFHQAPLISPLANAVAIPWVSFIVVPLTLLGSFLTSFFPEIGNMILFLAVCGMQLIWFFMEFLGKLPYANWVYTLPHLWVLLSIILGCVILFLPRGFPGRAYGFIAFLPLAFTVVSKPNIGEVWADVLDVGQGLSVVIRTANHVLLYDTGDQFSEQFNAASAVILPFLRGTQIKNVDKLVISHADRDHTGGAETLLREFSVAETIAGDRWKSQRAKVLPCEAEESWNWDGVEFTFLHPLKAESWEGNNASCVLKISTGKHSMLLTGDIESAAEKQLLLNKPAQLPSTVLIAPHHGSRTSSTLAFVKAVQPNYVIFPAGYLNRFRFPSAKIYERYLEQGSLALITATHGTIHLAFDAESFALPSAYKEQNRRYWHRH